MNSFDLTPVSAPQDVAARPPNFPAVPAGWYYLCRSDELTDRPVGRKLGGRSFVAFRDAAGRAVTLDGRCSHLGAMLAGGTVSDGRLQCPLHGWCYDGTGRCAHIPASDTIPPFARQTAYPTAEVGRTVAFYNAPAAPFDFPFYEGLTPADLLAAEPFSFDVNVPWYMISANAFDLQHFRMAHDRTLVGEPTMDGPAPFARRVVADFDVTGTTFRDKLTRRFSGPRVRMSVTSWGGTVILVQATFRRTTSYGMVFIEPAADPAHDLGPGGGRCVVRVVVWVPRRRGRLARAVLDPVDARIRRAFIRAFLQPDVIATDGTRYTPGTLIDADRAMADYMQWLEATCRSA